MLTDDAIPIELDGERGDLAPFAVLDDLAERARLAYIGEMDHFIAEKYDYRLLCIRYLASRGWRWFGEEWPDDPPTFTSGILVNERQPTGPLEAAQARFHDALRQLVPEARWFSVDAAATDTDYVALANAATTYEALRPAMARREQIMQAKVERVLRENPGEKVALLAAAQHLLKDDDTMRAPGVGAGPGGDTERSLGHHLAHSELVDGPILSFWLLHGEGTSANPWLPPPGRLRPAAGTLDAELLARVGRPCLVPVDGDHHRRSVTAMHNTVLHCRLDEQVDAIVFAPSVSPLREDHH